MSMRGGKGYLGEWDLDQDGVAVRAASCFSDMNSFFACWRSGTRIEKILGVRITCIFIRFGVHILLHFETNKLGHGLTVHGDHGEKHIRKCLQSCTWPLQPKHGRFFWSES